ncbi:MAG: hypothetical protein PHU75_02900 [Candidatus Nanopelagicales bacterium]|nr:hypothetical protein [Candidatus Nanopelagicales bacterium]
MPSVSWGIESQGTTSAIRTVGVVTVATNRYLDYWREMAATADEHLFPGHEVVMHVFTDRVDEALAMAGGFSRIRVNAIEVEALGWPDATLLRYSLIDRHAEHLQQDLLVHLDADMQVVADVGPELDPAHWPGGIALVRHPGYWRPHWPQRSALYMKKPRMAARDAVSMVQHGSVGMWERHQASRAFVPRSRRRTYVCGGTWMGLREPFCAMVHELATRTDADTQDQIMAIWHDESHLNWYASHHRTAFLGTEYCYALGFPNLAGMQARIVAVDKGDDRTR